MIAVATAVAIVARDADALMSAAPFLVLWTLAPPIAYWLSLPVGARVRPLSDRERTMLRRTARKTWRYFDTFVTDADAWLVPDNYQEAGDAPRLARRTSPTNIGMGLLSMVAAHDLGYISTRDLVRRLAATVTTLERLERHRGHFLNWYDTATTAPLHPRYVSTVDSGNLAASMMAVAQGLVDLIDRPQTRTQRVRGVADTADVLADASSSAGEQTNRRQILTEVNRLSRALAGAARTAAAAGESTGPVWTLSAQLASAAGELTHGETPDVPDEIWYWCRAVLEAVERSTIDESVPADELRTLAGRLSALVDQMRFEFLYDRRRRIFSIGYRLADAEGPGRLDSSFYDLLASEARWRASWPSPRATCRSTIGFISDAW